MTTQTLDVPGATPTYDVQRNDASTEPILLLIGSPMGAAGSGTPTEDDGSPNTDLAPTTARVTITQTSSGRTRMSIQSRFPSTEAMEQGLAMGVEEGLKQAVGQIDAILAEDATSSTTRR